MKEKWQNEKGPSHLRTIAEHYGIFDDLFGSAFFYNTNPLTVCYDYDEEFVTPVYYGNKIPPAEVRTLFVISKILSPFFNCKGIYFPLYARLQCE